MVELQGFQYSGWLLFIVVITYSLWIGMLVEKNRKNRSYIAEILEKLQEKEKEVDQYRSTVSEKIKEKVKEISALQQEVENLKLEKPFVEKDYLESMRQLNAVSIERDKYHDLAVDLYCQKHGVRTALEVTLEIEKVAISPISLYMVKKCKEIFLPSALFFSTYQRNAILGIRRDTCETVLIGYLPEDSFLEGSYKIFNEEDLG